MSSSPPNRLLASLVLVVVAGLACAAVALGSHFDPEQRLRAGDQARARAMLLRQSDLGPGFAVERTSDLDAHVTCKALDLSDLVVTGRSASPRWGRDLVVIGLHDSKALEARIKGSRIVIVRMRVAAKGIGLPDLQFAPSDRLAGSVEHPAGEPDDLALRAPWASWHQGEIASLRWFTQGIEGAENLIGRAWKEARTVCCCRRRLIGRSHGPPRDTEAI